MPNSIPQDGSSALCYCCYTQPVGSYVDINVIRTLVRAKTRSYASTTCVEHHISRYFCLRFPNMRRDFGSSEKRADSMLSYPVKRVHDDLELNNPPLLVGLKDGPILAGGAVPVEVFSLPPPKTERRGRQADTKSKRETSQGAKYAIGTKPQCKVALDQPQSNSAPVYASRKCPW